MRKLSITLLLAILIVPPTYAQEDLVELPPVLIAELQLGDAESAGNEYVELANTSALPVALEGVELQYRSKTGASWSTKAELEGFIAPFGRFLVSNYLGEHSQEFSGGLSGSSGHVRLLVDGLTIDMVAWGDAEFAQSEPTITHRDYQSLKRRVDEDGWFIDTNDDLEDWFVSDVPSPQFHSWEQAQTVIELPAEDAIDEEPEETVPEGSEVGVVQTTPIKITELFPDPKSPLTDAEHEFVELFNPGTTALNLVDYRIDAGTHWRYSFELGEYQLQPGERLAIFSSDSRLTLSNGGASVRVVGKDEVVHDEVTYEKAVSGQSWSSFEQGWEWATPTPHETNQLIAEAEQVLAATAESTPLQRREVEIPKVANEDSTANTKQGTLAPFESEREGANNWVLAGVGGSAVLYALYEYRHDIRIRIEQGRRYLAVRRENRSQS